MQASDETTSTTYTYDVANQLVTAELNDTIWHYEYDGDGSLIKALPNGDEAIGAKRYVYNAAGYLVQVESHNGSGWNTQAEMTYNGLGVRMTSGALGIPWNTPPMVNCHWRLHQVIRQQQFCTDWDQLQKRQTLGITSSTMESMFRAN